MTSDSKAVLMDGRVLAQHQAVLSLMRTWTQDPKVQSIRWLDLACGRGQILNNVERVIPERRREKIRYVGVDVSKDYALAAEQRARALFPSAEVKICELQHFELLLTKDDVFDIVTCTNTVHEISPESLAETFVAALCRVDADGCLFVYDMERLPELELGAIPWHGKEVEQIFHTILRAAEVDENSLPDVAVWPHQSCACWNLQLHRKHLGVKTLAQFRIPMIAAATSAIRAALQDKLLTSHSALNAAARFGAETIGDRAEVVRHLYDHWAINRTLGGSVPPPQNNNANHSS